MVVSIRNDSFKQGLQTAVRGAEAMNALRLLSRGKLQQGTIHLLEYKLATFGCDGHNETKPGNGRDSVLCELKTHDLADSSNFGIPGRLMTHDSGKSFSDFNTFVTTLCYG